MEYTDQSSGAIRLYLTKGNFNLDQFTILATKSLAWGAVSVSFGILGESHFVQLTKGGKIFSEICACTDAVIPEAVQVFESNFLANLPTEGVRTLFDKYTYNFSFEFKNWEEGSERLKNLCALQKKPGATYLTHTFPKLESDIEEPVTEVYMTEEDATLKIFSVHTYPNELVMVFTESELKSH
jgi:hypothetical protein